MVREFASGDAPAMLGDIEPELLDDAVSSHTRRFVGRINPRWMEGEHLPDHRCGEVEIARIAFE